MERLQHSYLNFAGPLGIWSGSLLPNLNEIRRPDAEKKWVKVQTLGCNISKTVRDTAVKFGGYVEPINLYQPDFFQIFPARGQAVVEGQSFNV